MHSTATNIESEKEKKIFEYILVKCWPKIPIVLQWKKFNVQLIVNASIVIEVSDTKKVFNRKQPIARKRRELFSESEGVPFVHLIDSLSLFYPIDLSNFVYFSADNRVNESKKNSEVVRVYDRVSSISDRNYQKLPQHQHFGA